MAYIYPFRATSTTATLLLIDPVAQDIIIGVRGDNAWVFPGYDSLPGGFMEARFVKQGQSRLMAIARRIADKLLKMRYVADEYHEGENSLQCAVREANEELTIDLNESQLVLFDVRANARTDTRAHVTNVCYYAVLRPEQTAMLEAGDDLKEIKRLPIVDLHLELPYEALAAKYPMAFNHFDLMMQGLAAYEREERCKWLEAEYAKLKSQVGQLDWDLEIERNRNNG